MDINEKALLFRAQAGDRQAAGLLYESNYQDVYTYVFYRIKDSATAEEISTEVFVKMIHSLPSFLDEGKPFISWLYSIARHLVNEYYLNQEIWDFLPEKDQTPEEGQLLPDYQFHDQESLACFRRALNRLEEQQKDLIIHRLVEGRSVQDIADLTKKSERTVRSLQRRALQSLEKALKKENCL
ncbi:MAG: sigma-70 family RNA polymerase sigma factor [Anaerolineales bacterium]|nr:sigma-70 family RNA polymerase sigma factor [Anaerolineales bacterium]